MARPISFSAQLQEYAEGVRDGRIVACKWVKLAVKRHLDDLAQSQENSEYPYRFATSLVERVCTFASKLRHTKGKWMGQLITLEPWEIFILGCIFGWIGKEDKLRRFTEAYIETCRKNGKSLISAIIGLYMLCADGEKGGEVYSGATTLKQAMEVFKPAWFMAQRDKEFSSRFGLDTGGTQKNPGNIYRLQDGSKFEPVIGKPGDGASPSCGIVDEYHEHSSPDLLETLHTGMGAREQPLLIVITTAGVDTSVPCYDKHLEAKKILEKSTERENLFCIIFTIDEDDTYENFDCWVKANPNLGVSIFEKNLRAKHEEALGSPAKRNAILTKHLNIWQNAGEAWMDMLKWNACCVPGMAINDFVGQECYVGMDLANRIDIAALRILFKYKNGWAGFGKYYLPADTVKKKDNAHYKKWVSSGHITETEGAVTDFLYIKKDIEEISKTFKLKELAYDLKESSYFILDLSQEKWTYFPCVEVGQSPSIISEPMKAYEGLIYSKNYAHNGCPVMTWMMSNVIKKKARGGGETKLYYPTKERNTAKIDGPVAEITALSRALAAVEPKGSVYEHRGIIVL